MLRWETMSPSVDVPRPRAVEKRINVDAKDVALAPAEPAETYGGNMSALWARLVTSVTGLAEGYDLSSISGAMVLIKKDIALTPQEVGLVVGLLYFAMAVGAPLGGALADRFGRKLALAGTYVLLITGCFCMSLASDFATLLAGRLVLGLGMGAGFTVVTTYMAEVSPKSHRGQYVCMEDLFIVVGVAIGYFSSYMLAGLAHDWRLILGLGALPAVAALCLVMLPQLVESPRWNMLRGEREQALKDLETLVGKDEACQMLEQWGHQDMQACTWLDVLCPGGRWRQRALVAGCGVLIATMLTGITVIMAYLSMILAEDFKQDQAFLLSFIIGSLRVVALSVSIFCILDTVGRKPLMLASLGGCATACAILALCYTFQSASVLKVLALTMFGVSFSLGMGPVPFVYCAEVFPTDVRCKSVGAGMFAARIIAGILNSHFPVFQDRFGLGICFAALAVLNFLSLFFVMFWAPETAGTSLEEMHRLFKVTGDP